VLPRAKKSYGQNFLVDGSVVGKIVSAAGILPGDVVLEVGPGTGTLTEALVAAGARVVAVEADHDLIPALREKFGDAIALVERDIFEYLSVRDLAILERPYKVIANIPYNITSPLLHHFLTAKNPPSRMVLMVQREVADRIVATPPDMSLLSVVCQAYADVSRVANVPRGAFRPVPRVDSAVVRFDLRHLEDVEDLESVIRLAKAGFCSRRKQLHRNVSDAGLASSGIVKDALTSFGLPATARAENLTVHNWIRLSRLI